MKFRGEKFATIEEQLKWAVLFALVLSALTAIRDIASMFSTYAQIEMWIWALATQLTLFLFWAFMSPIVLYAMQRTREEQSPRLKTFIIHVSVYTVLGVLFYFFVGLVNVSLWPIGKGESWTEILQWKWFFAVFLNSGLKYYVPILLGGALDAYYRRMRAEELKTAQLNEQLSKSQFRLLKMQLHPHFLFNALHSISTLVYTDQARADRMITELSDLLRLSLESTEVVTVPLREELHYVKKYLELERIRFSDRLQIRFSIAADTMAVDVPNLILQPLVENAIKHGTSKRPGPGTIDIKAYKQHGGLVLAVEDDGPGIPGSETCGIGMRNVRERLGRLYSHRARLSIVNCIGRGARQELFIPIDDINALFEIPAATLESAI